MQSIRPYASKRQLIWGYLQVAGPGLQSLAPRKVAFSIQSWTSAELHLPTPDSTWAAATMYRPIYGRHEEMESLENYCPGGLHPVHIHDKIADRKYEVIHKLGWGGWSTVWLARVQKCGRYVKIKIPMATDSSTGREVRNLHHLQAADEKATQDQGKRYVPSLLETFTIDGPNGRHQCLVTGAAGCSLDYTKGLAETAQFEADVGRAIAARFLLGVSFIHSRGMIHGDLHPGNILLRIPELSGSVEQVYEKYGAPEMTPVERLDGKPVGQGTPRYVVRPMHTIVSANRVASSDIVISDFGDAVILPDRPIGSRTPLQGRAPEFHLGMNEHYGQPGDIWTAACTIYHILGTVPLFSLFAHTPDEMLEEMANLLGPLPEEMMDKWELAPKFYGDRWDDDLGRPDDDSVERSIDDALDEMSYGAAGNDYSEDELEDLAELLSSMLKYIPSERVSADEACRSNWMLKWGLPAISRAVG